MVAGVGGIFFFHVYFCCCGIGGGVVTSSVVHRGVVPLAGVVVVGSLVFDVLVVNG